jgi:hypothetical protein
MEIKITMTIDNGEVKNIKIDKSKDEVKIDESLSVYARCFDESCPNWDKNPEMNLLFLKLAEVYCNEKLKSKGYLFLNEVYDQIGLPRSKAGQIVGWVYDEKNPIGDNYVDFGIYKTSNASFVNGYERSIWLDFNVDGIIMDKIP